MDNTVTADDVAQTQLQLAFSQESHYSVESDDGVHQAQFSFYRFPTDEEIEECETQAKRIDEQMSQVATSTDASLERMGSQAGYEADRSLSVSNQPSIESIAVMPDSVEFDVVRDTKNITVYRLDYDDGHSSKLKNEDDERLARTILGAIEGSERTARMVRPTIWRGRMELDGK
jgi:hypothetical protein